MANAKKCDRCGKYYTDRVQVISTASGDGDITFTDHPQVICFGEEGKITPSEKMDICYECFDSFIDWLNEYHNKGEYKND